MPEMCKEPCDETQAAPCWCQPRGQIYYGGQWPNNLDVVSAYPPELTQLRRRWYDWIIAVTGVVLSAIILSVIFYVLGEFIAAAIGLGNL
jgi:hypothetical protein